MSDQTVLEIACGTGYWTERGASTANRIVAVDVSEEVIQAAKSKSYPPETVQFGQADAYSLDSISGSFTAGFAGFWWSHVPKNRLQKFLQTFHNKLEHHAEVCFIDNMFVEGSNTPISHTDNEGNTYQIRHLEDGSEHRVLKNFPTAEELHEEVSNYATDIDIQDHKYYWTLSYTLDA